VKEEVYRVALRCGLKVSVVANSWMRVPQADWVEMVVVEGQFDAADDWIAERASRNDVVVTADIPLASRCLKAGARVISPRGRIFTEDSIGEALASRELQAHLREMGQITKGPSPLARQDRSRFLQALDQVIQAIRKNR